MAKCAYCDGEVEPGEGIRGPESRIYCDETCQTRYALLGSRPGSY